MTIFDVPRLTAVLGPTNTGKTHLAIERMLGYQTGMIGFPLRLLARENYDKIVSQKGRNLVALITGEEKIIPASARYFMCTVESMPNNKMVDFLAIDEIQLAADYERGYIFTEKLLRARGTKETMFLGALTIKRLLQKMIPQADFIVRPRLSKLTYSGVKKVTRLPKRSGIVAFSAQDVYVLAELVRQQKGGAAVVLGALSPRTRNAQVELYQNGEVDYLIATDAIGMGLNMNINHIAFAENSKFDGRIPRRLTAQELAQIAGRAGRYMNDGTFGVTGDCPSFEDETITAIEEHLFEPLKSMFWRNKDLSFDNLHALRQSLEVPAPHSFLLRKRDGGDHHTLINLTRNTEVTNRVNSSHDVRVLWDVCQIPDFRKTLTESHSRLLTDIFCHLLDGEGYLPPDWINSQIARFDRTDGDIDTLSGRIAHIRTWTYITNRSSWILDPIYWREKARLIEDKLSDALHEKLTQRFVDRRAAILVQKMHDSEELLSGVSLNGEVTVEGYRVGKLNGLNFIADISDDKNSKPVLAAVRKTLPIELTRRVQMIQAEKDECFELDDMGYMFWRDCKIGALEKGISPLKPIIILTISELVTNEQRDILIKRLSIWFSRYMSKVIPSLLNLQTTKIKGPALGILYQITEGLGNAPRNSLNSLIKGLNDQDKLGLTKLGLRFGIHTVFIPDLLKPRPIKLLAILWRIFNDDKALLKPLIPGRVSIPNDVRIHDNLYRAVGFVQLGAQMIRLDIVERLAAMLRKAAKNGEFLLNSEMLSLVGLNYTELAVVIQYLGYKQIEGADGKLLFRRRNSKKKDKKLHKIGKQIEGLGGFQGRFEKRSHKPVEKRDKNDFSPFSVLEKLKLVGQ